MKAWQRLIGNKKLWDKFFLREKIIQAIRFFFIKNKFHEVETPLLVPWVIPESYLDVFETHLKDRNKRNIRKMYLTTSPEAYIKKLLVAGIGNCFEITKSFRNSETGSNLHNPEFTILEWYRIDADYFKILRDCENLILHLNHIVRKNRGLSPSNYIQYQGKFIDLKPPWKKISVSEAMSKYAKISFADTIYKNKSKTADIFNNQKILKIAEKKGYNVKETDTWEALFNQIFLNEIEPCLATLEEPVVVYDYPLPVSALARRKPENPYLSERFELYIGGLELGDCYGELTDYNEQKRRFREEAEKIKLEKSIKINIDINFIEALKIGLPRCSGIAVGIDRLVMLFLDTNNISDTLIFSDMYK
ncbi:EF-P lysine aminoacylase GenX [Candidatus Gottesmanbacteria bacterium CG11_big_fil_rev_8_21_14_0_20_37_11]|uniref:EF-P lysine aminoacylase GenX n=3 Tax=Candidatus Gottesmaniibacteriota TaxID=1752720 RepID=A0A2M7RQA4_9BACT|nr:MAG: EF-P lysine aminoacylase GenX [Candidatus Gottesmanbacteria bacterium CG1_02_37_22]PIP32921.1 MAG: EF-P lysine aminoacylase GenX [Candidatus Gottesmanbacteria bacterium CG23_combo_of_CG06-09_8_20_14_all_37_19]PIR08002.1 MAG: EF-P lysine aminoacylase GenX [Candidatus Gottesmanbacteria bacterium CG11_big_fil_rev_8_21_14_0_20_37_11]PIZ02513.1 MAG: EF-P lysine aminoacylase GenX [Candidatus Gottesmanbacteria bacterium CG_4_10_14_0_8_um_filter_37_24]